MNKNQLELLIGDILLEADSLDLQPTLFSPAAVQLLLGTAAVESACGYYIEQLKGPAKGIFQMEPDTEKDIYENYLQYRPRLKDTLEYFSVGAFPYGEEMRWNLAYQIMMARIHYLRVPEELPFSNDIEGQAHYWKTYYNTHLGKGTAAKYIAAHHKYILNGV